MCSAPNYLLIHHNFPDRLIGGSEVGTRNLIAHLRRNGANVDLVCISPHKKSIYGAGQFHGCADSLLDKNLNPDLGSQLLEYFKRSKKRYSRVVFTHFLNLGAGVLNLVADYFGEAEKWLILHDYLLICAANGWLFHRPSKTACSGPGPAKCASCMSIPQHYVKIREDNAVRIVEAVDLLISPSRSLLHCFIQARPYFKGRMAHVEWINGDTRTGSLKLQGGKPCRRFLFCGQHTDVKGLALLLRAMETVLRSAPECSLSCYVITNSVRYAAEVSELSRRYGSNRIHFLQPVAPEQVLMLMRQYDCLVFPSIWPENAPIVIRQAMEAGIYIASSDLASVRELVGNYDGARFFTAGHLGEMVDCLGTLSL